MTSVLGGPTTSVRMWTRSRPALHGGSRAAWPGTPLFHSSGCASESGRLVLITRCLHSETDSGALRGRQTLVGILSQLKGGAVTITTAAGCLRCLVTASWKACFPNSRQLTLQFQKAYSAFQSKEVHIQLAASQRQLKGRLSLVLLADLVQLLSRV